MANLVVVNQPKDWPLEIPGVEVVAARTYLADPSFSGLRGVRVFNLCRSYKYQSLGYYVSLLAEARGHKPVPNLGTVLDFKSTVIVRYASDELEHLIQKSLAPIHSQHFTLSIYFGQNMARRHQRLASELYKSFQAPLVRAEFRRQEDGTWSLQSVRPISGAEIPPEHRPFALEVAKEYFAGRFQSVSSARRDTRYDLAILFDPQEEHAPSNEKAIERFVKAGRKLRLGIEVIGKDDYSRLGEFDALFIRETTGVNHHTYRFARRGVADGLVVIDDPDSILRCMNKVFLAELLARHRIPQPKTVIVHRDNKDAVAEELGTPCILKQPDSAFSLGVKKVDDHDQLKEMIEVLLEKSDLIIAQEFLPTAFDWRVGILDRQPLYVCRYHMARKHWQIVSRESGEDRYGQVETLPVEFAPREVVQTALKAANLIGDSLYGVDLKQVGKKVYVIEVNDNPNLDAGFEDAVLKNELYETILQVFIRRIERRKAL